LTITGTIARILYRLQTGKAYEAKPPKKKLSRGRVQAS